MREHRRRSLKMLGVSAVVVAVAGVPAAAVASAAAGSQNVVVVIKAQDRKLRASPAAQQLAQFQLSKRASLKVAKAALPSLRTVVSLTKADVAAVRESSTTDARQRQGKADYVNGVTSQIRGLIDLEHELADVTAGNKAAANHAFVMGEKLLGAGNVVADRGDKLLGLSTDF